MVAKPVMSGAREQIVDRIRAALGDVTGGEQAEAALLAHDYRREDERSGEELVGRFAERVRDYHAEARVVSRGSLADEIALDCARLGVTRAVVPPGLPDDWRPGGTDLIEDAQLSAIELDGFDAAITGCAVAMADTGTVALDGGERCGRRAITLVPDCHICVVEAEQIVGLVPQAISQLARAAGNGAPITLISGPSASSDIELQRVEGVHGPRRLQVLIAL